MEDSSVQAAFELPGLPPMTKVEVLGENRTVQAKGHRFEDDFKAYEVHLYRLEFSAPKAN
jgi:hypothetical protein